MRGVAMLRKITFTEHVNSESPTSSAGGSSQGSLKSWPRTPFSSRRRLERLGSSPAGQLRLEDPGEGVLRDLVERLRDARHAAGPEVAELLAFERLASVLHHQASVLSPEQPLLVQCRCAQLRPSISLLADRAWELAGHARRDARLRRAAERWLGRQPPWGGAARRKGESADERLLRLDDFWPRFHEVLEVRRKSGICPGGPEAGPHRPSSSASSEQCRLAAAKAPRSLQPPQPRLCPEGARKDAEGRRKARPARGKGPQLGRDAAQKLDVLRRTDPALPRVQSLPNICRSLPGPEPKKKPTQLANLSSFLTPKQFLATASPQRRGASRHARGRGSAALRSASGSADKSEPAPCSAGVFSGPWPAARCLPQQISPVQQYVQSCQSSGVLPALLPFVTGHSSRLGAAGQDLADGDLHAVTAMVGGVRVEEVDLGGSVQLSDGALCAFLQALSGLGALQRLGFGRCLGLGPLTLGCIQRLLSEDEGCRNLQHLDLGGVRLPAKVQVPLCTAVRKHPALRAVCLAETGLGDGLAPWRCVGELLGCKGLRTLDLSWNRFSGEVLAHTGARLAETGKLEALSLANCSAAVAAGGECSSASPMVYLAERLGRCTSLTRLDLSINRLDARGALVLEDALDSHPALTQLNVAQNPLGALGLRSVVRLLLRATSCLEHLVLDGCGQGVQGLPGGPGGTAFSPASPCGRYILDLAQPYDRALLRMLYKASIRYGMAPEAAFLTAVGTPPYEHPRAPTDGGPWQVPEEGQLTVVFSSERAREGAFANVADWDFDGFLQQHRLLMRIKPRFDKMALLCAHWQRIDGHEHERCALLDALSKDFLLGYTDVRQFCHRDEVACEVVSRLLPCLVGGAAARYLCMLLVPSLADSVRILQRARRLLTFNAQNPTGRYRLDLANPADFAIAARLQLLDRWEAGVARRQRRRVDISQRGNRSHFRNERYQQQCVARALSEWQLPEHGLLELDYLSDQRTPADARPLGEEAFWRLMAALQASECPPSERVVALRAISHLVHVTAVQLRELLAALGSGEARVDLVVLLLLRLTDVHNEKLFRVRLSGPGEVQQLWLRLGHLSYFPFLQPEQASFELNLAVHDQRLAANLLVQLAFREGEQNLRDVSLIRPDGRPDPLTTGVPRTWEIFEKMPSAGVFRAQYACSPDDRRFELRRGYLEAYGHWHAELCEEEVVWWSALDEVPDDVLEFLEFLCARFADVRDAFVQIAGAEREATLSLQKFELGVRRLGCRRFEGNAEFQRLQGVFRYMDRNGNGKITAGEWAVLHVLSREIQLSLREFVHFLRRHFADDLEQAWVFFDTSGAGHVAEEQWCQRARAAQYCGPLEPIFRFLDRERRGLISKDEFMVLQSIDQRTSNAFLGSQIPWACPSP